MNPYSYLDAPIERLEALSIDELKEIQMVAESENNVLGACGSCLYGLELPCTCGVRIQVTKELLGDLIEYKQR